MAEPRAEKRGTLRGPPSSALWPPVVGGDAHGTRSAERRPDDVVGSHRARRTYAASRQAVTTAAFVSETLTAAARGRQGEGEDHARPPRPAEDEKFASLQNTRLRGFMIRVAGS